MYNLAIFRKHMLSLDAYLDRLYQAGRYEQAQRAEAIGRKCGIKYRAALYEYERLHGNLNQNAEWCALIASL